MESRKPTGHRKIKARIRYLHFDATEFGAKLWKKFGVTVENCLDYNYECRIQVLPWHDPPFA